MKKRVSPGFYNSEMESKYFKLYLTSRKLVKKKNNPPQDFESKLVKFEVQYYSVSKANKILNENSKMPDEIIHYLEPTWLKQKVDKNAQALGIKPYDQLDKKEDDFIMTFF